jgi:hypothetical protein
MLCRGFLNLAGEFLVAAETQSEEVLCSVTYGASGSADLFAFTDNTGRVVRIEVTTTTRPTCRWAKGCPPEAGFRPEYVGVRVASVTSDAPRY